MTKNDIGFKAGVIWHLLANRGALNIREIGEATNYKEVFIVLALGWLAREDNIRFFKKQDILHIELINYPIPEIYY